MGPMKTLINSVTTKGQTTKANFLCPHKKKCTKITSLAFFREPQKKRSVF